MKIPYSHPLNIQITKGKKIMCNNFYKPEEPNVRLLHFQSDILENVISILAFKPYSSWTEAPNSCATTHPYKIQMKQSLKS